MVTGTPAAGRTGRRTRPMMMGGAALIVAAVTGYLGFWKEASDTMGETNGTSTVLSIGLHPSALDYSRIPGLDEETLTARIAAGDLALREAGFDVVTCLVSADPGTAESELRDCAGETRFAVVMIGAGLRMMPEHTLLFERIVNVAGALSPGVGFCFNTSPETTADAIRRWVQPAARR